MVQLLTVRTDFQSLILLWWSSATAFKEDFLRAFQFPVHALLCYPLSWASADCLCFWSPRDAAGVAMLTHGFHWLLLLPRKWERSISADIERSKAAMNSLEVCDHQDTRATWELKPIRENSVFRPLLPRETSSATLLLIPLCSNKKPTASFIFSTQIVNPRLAQCICQQESGTHPRSWVMWLRIWPSEHWLRMPHKLTDR